MDDDEFRPREGRPPGDAAGSRDDADQNEADQNEAGPETEHDGGEIATGPDDGGEVDDAPAGTDPRPDAQPDSGVVHRRRGLVGGLVVLACLAVAAYFAVVGPADAPGGARGLIVRFGAPACWVLLAGVALTWALRAPRRTTNLLAALTLAAYLTYTVARLY